MPEIAVLLSSIVRAFLLAVLGGLVTKGYLTADQLEQIILYVIGGGGLVAMIVWSVVRNSLKGLLERVAASPEVSRIEAEPDLANSIQDTPGAEKVVPDDLSRGTTG